MFPNDAGKVQISMVQCHEDAQLKIFAKQYCTGTVLDDRCKAVHKGLVKGACDYNWFDKDTPLKYHPLIEELMSPKRRWKSLGLIATNHCNYSITDNDNIYSHYWSMTFAATGGGASGNVSLTGIDSLLLRQAVFFPPFWITAEEPLGVSVTTVNVRLGLMAARKPHGIIMGPDSGLILKETPSREPKWGRPALIVGSTVKLSAGTWVILSGRYASLLFNEFEDISVPPNVTICITGGGNLGGSFGGYVEFRDGASKDLARGWTYFFKRPMVVSSKTYTNPSRAGISTIAPPKGAREFWVDGMFFAYRGNLSDFKRYDKPPFQNFYTEYTGHYLNCLGEMLNSGFSFTNQLRQNKAMDVKACPSFTGRHNPITPGDESTPKPYTKIRVMTKGITNGDQSGYSTNHPLPPNPTGTKTISVDQSTSKTPGPGFPKWAIWVCVSLAAVVILAGGIIFICYKSPKQERPWRPADNLLAARLCSPTVETPGHGRGSGADAISDAFIASEEPGRMHPSGADARSGEIIVGEETGHSHRSGADPGSDEITLGEDTGQSHRSGKNSRSDEITAGEETGRSHRSETRTQDARSYEITVGEELLAVIGPEQTQGATSSQQLDGYQSG